MRVKSEKMVHVSARTGPAQSRAGAAGSTPSGQDGPCREKLPASRERHVLAHTPWDARYRGGGDQRGWVLGACPHANLGISECEQGRAETPPTFLLRTCCPGSVQCKGQGWGPSAACPHQLCDRQLSEPWSPCLHHSGTVARPQGHGENHSQGSCTKRPTSGRCPVHPPALPRA